MTNTEAMRAEFEAHMRKAAPTYAEEILLGRAASGKYSSLITEFCWQSWQAASRSSEDKGVPEGFSAGIEAAARLLDNDADRQEKAWQEYLASGLCGPATSLHTIPREYAREVRALATEAGTESAEQYIPENPACKTTPISVNKASKQIREIPAIRSEGISLLKGVSSGPEKTFTEFAKTQMPWLLDPPEDDAEKLLTTTATIAFRRGYEAATKALQPFESAQSAPVDGGGARNAD